MAGNANQISSPPRRRPGPNWKGCSNDWLCFVTAVPQLGPGLRRGGGLFDGLAFLSSLPTEMLHCSGTLPPTQPLR